MPSENDDLLAGDPKAYGDILAFLDEVDRAG
jgi:hypothetical protein